MKWPYDDRDNPIAEASAPSWECPEGICDCHPIVGKSDPHEFSVMLFSPEGKRMEGARCRILYQGHVVNEADPYADSAGWVTAVVPRVPATVLIEWAPHDTPHDPAYPFRTWYYIDLNQERDEAARRRLHNLGYSRSSSLRENVKSFQREFGNQVDSGQVEDIEGDLIAYHDEGQVPYRPLTGAGGGAALTPDKRMSSPEPQKANGGVDSEGLAEEPGPASTPGKPIKQPPAPPPPTKGKASAGQGAAMAPLNLPTVVEVLGNGEGLFEFVRIFSKITTRATRNPVSGVTTPGQTLAGFFWILGEALLWEIPDTDPWRGWTESYYPLAIKPHCAIVKNNRRLCRLPCNAEDSQIAANMIAMTQADLLSATTDGMTTQFPPVATGMESSLLATPKLYDLLYLQADLRIKYQYVPGMDKRSLPDMSNEYQVKVNGALLHAINASSGARSAKSVGTPGKIWAIDERMETWQIGDDGGKFICAINYGFHDGGPTPTVVQSPGARHNQKHVDYSQILSVVAGWCLVMGPTETVYRWRRTEDVYLSAELAPLVTANGLRAPRARYTGTAR